MASASASASAFAVIRLIQLDGTPTWRIGSVADIVKVATGDQPARNSVKQFKRLEAEEGSPAHTQFERLIKWAQQNPALFDYFMETFGGAEGSVQTRLSGMLLESSENRPLSALADIRQLTDEDRVFEWLLGCSQAKRSRDSVETLSE